MKREVHEWLDGEWFEQPKHPSDISHCSQYSERQGEIGQGLVPSQPSHLDMYDSGAAVLHIHFAWFGAAIPPRGGQLPADYRVVLRKLIVGEGMMRQFPGVASDRDIGNEIPHTATHGDKSTVLIRVIESADDAEYPAVGFRSSVIRLRLYNDCPSAWVQPTDGALEVFPHLGIVYHELAISVFRENVMEEDREAGAVALFSRYGCDDNVIECASEVVYEIPEDQSDPRVRLLRDSGSVANVIMAIRPPDADKLVRVAFGIPPGLGMDIYHVLLSPLDLEPPRVSHRVDSTSGRERANTQNTDGHPT